MNTFETVSYRKPFDESTESIFDSLSDGIFTHSFFLHDDYIRCSACSYVNGALSQLIGVEREILLTMYPSTFFKKESDSFYDQALRDYLSHKKSVYQTYITNKENRHIPVELSVTAQEIDGVLFATCILKKSRLSDTFQPETSETITTDTQQFTHQSIDQMTVLSTLISGIAHEINNPNNIISLSTDLVKDIWYEVCEYIEGGSTDSSEIIIHGQEMPALSQNVRNLLDNILSGSDRINRTISAIRDFVRIDSNEKLTDCNLISIVKSSLLLCDDILKKNTSDFIIQYDSDIPHSMAYLRLVQQAIVNVVRNACEALTERSQKITLTVSYQRENNSVLVSIADEGQGMAPDIIPQIFNPFFTTRRNKGNLGLGLSVTHAIMQKHKGSISIDSKHGFGTTVTLRFPAVHQVLHQK